MSADTPLIGWINAEGSPRELGHAIGRAGRDAVHAHLLPSAIWAEITAERHAPRVAVMEAAVRTSFPRIAAELDGLAEGLGLPFEQVLAWNCRGDILATVPDGCTTVLQPGNRPLIAHNEDGLPFFHGHCFMLDARPEGEAGFVSFCYPGSLPGHTLAVTRRGLVQTVNNIRLTGLVPEIPRMVLARATLTAASIDAAVDLLRGATPSGGFHLSFAQAGDARILSVEFGGGEVSAHEISAPAVHANHVLHLPGALARQIITDSSRDRQARGEELLAAGDTSPLALLQDTDGPGLPVYRDTPDDPDDENTLATAVFTVGAGSVAWQVHDRRSATPVWSGTLDAQALARA